MSQRSYLIYQDIAEPIPPTPIVETVTIDKWFQLRPNPVLRKSLSSAIVAGAFFFVNIQANDANARVPEWHPQTNQPQRLVTALSRQNLGGEVGVLKQCTTITDDSFDTLAFGQTDLGLAQTQVGQAFTSHGGRLSAAKFYLVQTNATSGNIRAKLYNGTGSYGFSFLPTGSEIATSDDIDINTVTGSMSLITFTFSGANRINLDKNGQYVIAVENTNGDASNRLRIAIVTTSQHSGNLSFFNGSIWASQGTWDTLFYVETCTIVDGEVPQYWIPPIQQPRIVKTRQLLGGESRFEIPRTILISDWFAETQQPRIIRRPQLLGGESRFEVPREILLSDWFRETEQPRIIRRPQLLGGDAFRTEVIFETITLDKWFQPTQQPYFTKRRLYHSGETRFEIPRDILVSDWFDGIKQPYFTRRRDVNTGEFRFEVPRIILITDWFQEIHQPRIIKVRQLLGGEFRTEVVAPIEVVTVDKWFMPIVQPYLKQVRQNLGGNTFTVQEEFVTLDKWFREILQPFFPKTTINQGRIILDWEAIVNPITDHDTTVYNCCIPVIIPFVDTDEMVINYSQGMRNAFGDVPTVMVYHEDENGEFVKATIRVTFVDYPATQIKIFNGGEATGYVRISQ